MIQKNSSLAAKIWYIAYPFLFYYAVMLTVMTVAQWIFGSGNEHFVTCQLVATLVTIPFMMPFYRQDQALLGIERRKPKFTSEKGLTVLWVIAAAALIGIGLDNIISMSPLVELSAGYQEANAGFYGGTLVMELLSSALFTPILEELVFRGILFPRLKALLPLWVAVVGSSLLFAIMHFNIVQFVYALFLGIVLAIFADRGGNVCYAVFGHMTINLLAVLRTETGLLSATVQGNTFSWVISGAVLAVGVLLFIVFLKKNVEKDSKCNKKI